MTVFRVPPAFAVAMSSKPLASWKTWWGPELPCEIAKVLFDSIDPRNLPRGGKLLTTDSFRAADLKDVHISSLVEGLLKSYPGERQPSGYLLGDAILELDKLMNHMLIGHPQENPVKETSRRDDALAEGGKLRKLLSFMRTSALKSDVGRTPESTYLKQLANERPMRSTSKSSLASTRSPSTASCGSPPE